MKVTGTALLTLVYCQYLVLKEENSAKLLMMKVVYRNTFYLFYDYFRRNCRSLINDSL